MANLACGIWDKCQPFLPLPPIFCEGANAATLLIKQLLHFIPKIHVMCSIYYKT